MQEQQSSLISFNTISNLLSCFLNGQRNIEHLGPGHLFLPKIIKNKNLKDLLSFPPVSQENQWAKFTVPCLTNTSLVLVLQFFAYKEV